MGCDRARVDDRADRGVHRLRIERDSALGQKHPGLGLKISQTGVLIVANTRGARFRLAGFSVGDRAETGNAVEP